MGGQKLNFTWADVGMAAVAGIVLTTLTVIDISAVVAVCATILGLAWMLRTWRCKPPRQ